MLELVGDVAVVIWPLGSARPEGPAGEEEVRAIHGERLERLLERLVDTPVRGFVYEAAGSVESNALAAGRRAVENAAATWRIPVAVVEAGAEESGGLGRGDDRGGQEARGLTAAAGKIKGLNSDRN